MKCILVILEIINPENNDTKTAELCQLIRLKSKQKSRLNNWRFNTNNSKFNNMRNQINKIMSE